MANRTCTIDGCDKKHFGRGYCSKHYSSYLRHGDPLAASARYKTPDEAFAARTEWQGDHLIWTGDRQTQGYGRISVDGRYWLTHRYAYARANGPIPEGLHVDHICHVRLCVNIAHLRLVTNKQNQENRLDAERGVSWDGRRWVAYIRHNYERTYIGRFDDRQAAVAAATAKRLELFTHNNHDREA